MKHLTLLLSFLILSSFAFAQDLDQDHYTVSGGLLGALNFTKFRVDGDAAVDVDYNELKLGWSAGAFLTLPLGDEIALEPQILYSKYAYQTDNGSALLLYGNLSAITIPVSLKFYSRNSFALTFGPQFDLIGTLEDVPFGVEEDDFASTSISLTAGLEILPRGPVTVYGRFIYGLTDMDNRDVNDELSYYQNGIQAGLKVRLFGKMIPADTDNDGIIDREDQCPTVAGIASMMGCPDTDNDGITDASDECPTIAGISRYKGCPIPDTDNDGVNDEVDKCPKVAGTAKYNGCPIPDTDNDGVNDEEDKCPSVAGLMKYNGCPIPDTDKDGVNDEVDKCPTVAGLASNNGCPNPDRDNDNVVDVDDWCPDIKGPVDNHGCPKVESAVFNTKMIQFVSGSANLTPQAKKDLREGAKLLNSGDFKDLKVEIQGHTDNVGSGESNHTLSHKRAESVKAELIKDGVAASRLTTVGFGEDKPIADNSTSAGRALNRRVELIARQ